MVFPPVVTSAGTSLLLRFLQILFAGLLALGIAACSPPGVSFDRVAGEDIDDGGGGIDPPPVPEQVVTPVFNLLAEPTEALSQRVTISTTTAGATIFFTRDGSNPTAASEEYTGTITLTETTTLTAFAVLDGFTDSEFAQTEVVIRPPPALDIRLGEERLVEAEDYTSRDDSFDNAEWEEVTVPAGFLGDGAMQIPTTASVSFPTDYTIDSARLDFRFNFLDAGTYFVWVRAYAANGSSDTVHVGLDGQAVPTGETLRASRRGDWAWSNTQLGTGERIRIDVAEAGIHTLNLWMREPGFIVDRLIITSNAAFAPVTEAPIFSPDSGNYSSGTLVTLSTTTAGADIYYTTDGSTPTLASTLYTGPITITSTTEIQAIARLDELNTSPVTLAQYNVTDDLIVVQPGDADGMIVIEAENYTTKEAAFDDFEWEEVTSPAGFVADGAMQVPSGASVAYPTGYVDDSARIDYRIRFNRSGVHYIWIRSYAQNGAADTAYIGLNGAAIGADEILRVPPADQGAWTWVNNKQGSGSPLQVNIPSSGVHTLNIWMREVRYLADRILLTTNPAYVPTGDGPAETGFATVETPVITPASGHYVGGTPVTITSTTVDTEIYYTLDGSTPSASSTLYTGPFDVTSNVTIRAIGILEGLIDSDIAEATFTVGNFPPVTQPTDGDSSIIIEAENYTSRGRSYDDYVWELVTSPAGFVADGAMQVPPAAGVAFPTDYATDSARLDYAINFTQTGTHYVWVRGFAANGGRDTLHVGLDGVAVSTGEQLRVPATGDWTWSNRQFNTGQRIRVTIDEPGLHTLNLWMRESGFIADRILITPEAAVSPAGEGPTETPITDPGSSNSGPALSTLVDIYAFPGDTVDLDITATDADGVAPAFVLDVSSLPGSPTLNQSGSILNLNWTVPAATSGEFPLTVIVTDPLDEALTDSQTFTIRIVPSDSDAIIQQADNPDGMVVAEAEAPFTSTTGALGHTWQTVTNVSAAGGEVLQALPELNTSINGDDDILSRSPRLDYLVNFDTAGTYYVWVRGIAVDSGSDSVHLGVDGQVTTRSLSGFTLDGQLSWANDLQFSVNPATLTIPSPGVHTISVWMREDSFSIDKFLLTEDASFVPVLNGPSANTSGPSTTLVTGPDGQIFAWNFEEDPSLGTATDAILGTDLTCALCPAATTGFSGNAAAFGGGQSFSLTNASELNVANGQGFSVELRTRFAATCGGEEGIVARQGGASALNLALGCDGGVAKAQVTDAAGNAASPITSTTAIDDGDWHTVHLVYDADYDELRLYVDGALEGSTSATFAGGFSDSDADLFIGFADFGSGDSFTNAIVDDVVFHNRSLSTPEIQRQAQSLTQGLVGDLYSCKSPVRIMPMGDSITAGNNSGLTDLYGTYRPTLYTLLEASGYSIDFVGSRTSLQPGDPDLNHEGWPGYLVENLRARINEGLIDMNQPDIILLHIGTNSVETAPARIPSLLTTLTTREPLTAKVVAKIIDRRTSDPETLIYNSVVESEVNSRISGGERFTLVDMESVTDQPNDYLDEVHINSDGADKMASVWFDALVDLLPRCVAASPMLTDPGTLAATSGVPWSYTVEVLGHPIGSFTLDSAPVGVTLNTETGELRWSSPNSGTHTIQISVTNTAGSDTQSYSLVVP